MCWIRSIRNRSLSRKDCNGINCRWRSCSRRWSACSRIEQALRFYIRSCGLRIRLAWRRRCKKHSTHMQCKCGEQVSCTAGRCTARSCAVEWGQTVQSGRRAESEVEPCRAPLMVLMVWKTITWNVFISYQSRPYIQLNFVGKHRWMSCELIRCLPLFLSSRDDAHSFCSKHNRVWLFAYYGLSGQQSHIKSIC